MKPVMTVLCLLALSLGPGSACDPNHVWLEQKVIFRKIVTPRAIESLLDNVLTTAASAGHRLDNSTVALSAADDAPGKTGTICGGVERLSPIDEKGAGERRELIVSAVRRLLATRGARLIEPREVASSVDPAAIKPGGILTPRAMEQLRTKVGATHFLRLRLTDYSQMVRLDKDALPINKDVYVQYVFESVKARVTLQDGAGKPVQVGEADGLVKDGYLWQGLGGVEPMDKLIEYFVDRPGGQARTNREPGTSGHLGLDSPRPARPVRACTRSSSGTSAVRNVLVCLDAPGRGPIDDPHDPAAGCRLDRFEAELIRPRGDIIRIVDARLPPDCQERYEIVRALGGGAQGAVFLARQIGLERPVALKVLAGKFAARDEAKRRFLREARLTAALSHPGIVKVLDFGVETGIPWIAYEYVDGTSLREHVNEAPPDLVESLGFGVQIAGALEAAHSQGIVHRDLKPDNVLLTAGG
ncbi:MAG: serine/threonine protein kinase, partial [Candidatus Riflebacteria bacterium]|nr:serine/threonine protein kinase [Candidatus Riflebacteria bacterium]